MGILTKIRRHAAVASADFACMFKQVEIPPLPAAATRLIAEINKPEPDIGQLEKLISSTAGITAKVLKTVNSSLFAPRVPIGNVKHAVALLGFRNIRSIALGYATMEALPVPKGDLFDPEAFWTDSLVRAMLARALSKKNFNKQLEDAFSASLLADVALPVLLHAWQEYYEPIIREWMESSRRLSEIEREHFSWDHAQAGAWIVQSWGFPEEMVCYIGAHNLSWKKIQEHELEETIAVPMAVATLSSSVLKPDLESAPHVFSAAVERLAMTSSEFLQCLADVEESLEEILEMFGLPDRNAARVLNDLETAATWENEEVEP